ncbi:hypothetical protein QBC44DRAFT_371926 [Cladorrhinum sp. PSN332]|nr:hypothetical protein QBC44DRAFT_371926 [Cladorrhinum sp. PSN332]
MGSDGPTHEQTRRMEREAEAFGLEPVPLLPADTDMFGSGDGRDHAAESSFLLTSIPKKSRYMHILCPECFVRANGDKSFEDVNNGTFRGDEDDRAEVLEMMAEKLKQYNLISVAHKEKTSLRDIVDNSLWLRTLPIWKHREEDVAIYDVGQLAYYSDKRMDKFSSGIIVFLGAVMFIVPIWTLQALEKLKLKLAVITVFVFVLLVVMSSIMVTKPYEALGITAACAAVLMVFVQFGTSCP